MPESIQSELSSDWRDTLRRRDRLYERCVHKALDIPEAAGLHIDQSHNYYGEMTADKPPPLPGQPDPAATPVRPATAGVLRRVLPLAIAAGLGATGVGLPAAAVLLPELMTAVPPVSHAQPATRTVRPDVSVPFDYQVESRIIPPGENP